MHELAGLERHKNCRAVCIQRAANLQILLLVDAAGIADRQTGIESDFLPQRCCGHLDLPPAQNSVDLIRRGFQLVHAVRKNHHKKLHARHFDVVTLQLFQICFCFELVGFQRRAFNRVNIRALRRLRALALFRELLLFHIGQLPLHQFQRLCRIDKVNVFRNYGLKIEFQQFRIEIVRNLGAEPLDVDAAGIFITDHEPVFFELKTVRAAELFLRLTVKL